MAVNEKAHLLGLKVGRSLRSFPHEGRVVWQEARVIADKATPVTQTYPYEFGKSKYGQIAVDLTSVGTALSAANVVRGVTWAGQELSPRERAIEGALVVSSAALSAVDIPLGVEIAIGAALTAAVQSKK